MITLRYGRMNSSRSYLRKALTLVFLLPLAAASQGCGSGGSEASSRGQKSPALNRPAPSPEKPREARLKIVEDEPTLRGGQSVIGGDVLNVSDEKLENVSLSLELTRRGGGGKEVREVGVAPSTLAPGAEGRYSLTVSNREWAASKIVAVRSSDEPAGVAFVTEPGARRPPERLPEGVKTVVVRKPRPKGEEFLNSPDNPEKIP